MERAIENLKRQISDTGSSKTNTHTRHVLSGERLKVSVSSPRTNPPEPSEQSVHYKREEDRSYTERNGEWTITFDRQTAPILTRGYFEIININPAS
jgi:hypothetical protein